MTAGPLTAVHCPGTASIAIIDRDGNAVHTRVADVPAFVDALMDAYAIPSIARDLFAQDARARRIAAAEDGAA